MKRKQIQLIENFIEHHLQKKFEKKDNVLDPFDMLFSQTINQTSFEKWFEHEKYRQKNKTLLNKIGKFHELLGASFDGWEHQKFRFDLINERRKIAFEIKNKWNTVNSGGMKTLERNFKKFKEQNLDWEIYLVHIIVKHSFERKHNTIYTKIDGKEFYRILSGDENFFFKLVTKEIPKALKNKMNIKVDSKFIKEITKNYNDTYCKDKDN